MQKMLNNYTVYCHKNLADSKLYFGITSLTLNNRWGTKGQNYKNNLYFSRAIKKYGWDNFEHIIVKDNLPEACAKTLEKILIYKYNTRNPKYGYNLTDGGDGTCGYTFSQDYINDLRIRISGEGNPFYGKQHSDESKYKMRKARLGKTPWNKGTKLSDKEKQLISERQCKKVYKYDLDGNFICEYRSAKEAGEKNNVTSSSISRSCRKNKPCKNYKYYYGI